MKTTAIRRWIRSRNPLRLPNVYPATDNRNAFDAGFVCDTSTAKHGTHRREYSD